MDQDSTQVRILRPPSRDENCVRPKLTDHGTIEVLSMTKTSIDKNLKGWYSYLKAKYLISEVQN
jgi:hypothetical protein